MNAPALLRVIYLVGINHKYQVNPADCYIGCGVSESESAEFREMLRTAIGLYDIKGIAEEMSSEGLRKLRGADWVDIFRHGQPEFQNMPEPEQCDSIGFNLAKNMALKHRYCDPDSGIRHARGMKEPKDREPYWIEQLCNFDGFPTLFILGADHVSSFTNLLKGSGFQPFVLVADWDPTSCSGLPTETNPPIMPT